MRWTWDDILKFHIPHNNKINVWEKPKWIDKIVQNILYATYVHKPGVERIKNEAKLTLEKDFRESRWCDWSVCGCIVHSTEVTCMFKNRKSEQIKSEANEQRKMTVSQCHIYI